MARDLTWPDAIQRVLSESSELLHYTDIVDLILSKSLRKKIGKTPQNTVNRIINQSVNYKGQESPYRRVDRGVFILASKIQMSEQENKDKGEGTSKNKPSPYLEEESEEGKIVSSFGMFWRREEVEWTSRTNTRLLGVQRGEAEEVDFSQQISLYLLYDGREVIYVGRVRDSTLGGRLYEHTRDRLSARWDRFSWFGFLPVFNDGKLGKPQDLYSSVGVIAEIEAILIEALEPREPLKKGEWIC